MFGEALFTHLGKHLGGRPDPKHAQLKKVDYPIRDCGSRRKDRRKRYIWTCLIFVRNMVAPTIPEEFNFFSKRKKKKDLFSTKGCVIFKDRLT